MTVNNRTISNLRSAIAKNGTDIKELKKDIKQKDIRPNIQAGINKMNIRKSCINPEFTNKTVLTDSTWRYVELYLKRKKNHEALNYWIQAENFFNATQHLDVISKPLTTYYCFLNATKALLTFKEVAFSLKHGVSGKKLPGRVNILNELVSIHPRGVLAGLIRYLGELIPSGKETYNLKDILYNLEYIHRAYKMTFSNQPELFLPVEDIRFVHDKHRKVGWLEIKLEPQYSNQSSMKKLSGYSIDRYYSNNTSYVIRRNKTFHWNAPRNKPTAKSIKSFVNYYHNNRRNYRYIYSPNKLWYIKRKNVANGIIDRNTLILTFAAMHRLSEMSR